VDIVCLIAGQKHRGFGYLHRHGVLTRRDTLSNVLDGPDLLSRPAMQGRHFFGVRLLEHAPERLWVSGAIAIG
jgi:hypothetical protein